MNMAFLYVTEQGAVLRKRGHRIVVEKDDKEILDVPCDRLQVILIFGNITLTTPALSELLDQGIEVALLTRRGRLKGQLTPVKSRNIHLRLAQFRRYDDETFRSAVGRTIVAAKIAGERDVLADHLHNHPETEIADAIARLDRTANALAGADSREKLLGQEGAAGAAYFAALGKMCRKELRFERRSKHPPLDPVNALLSLGYTLLFNELQWLLDAVGFDPYVGLYHDIEYGRASLAADLLEEFRAPVVDRLVLRLINTGVLVPEHFVQDPTGAGVRLELPAFRLFLTQFDRAMTKTDPSPATGGESFRTIVREQVAHLARVIVGGEPAYLPWNMRPRQKESSQSGGM
jgi:CRISPR-associated protein Cas1